LEKFIMVEKSRQPEIARRIADYVVAARPDDLPEPVRREALRSFVNIVGCMLGGARHEVIGLADDVLSEFSGPPQATLLGRARRADVLHAALINCFGSSIHAFDDTHEQAVVHPSGPVAAAILAMSERKRIAGPQFLLAFALGVEAICRLSKAISVPPAKGVFAWSQTGITAGIGAAVAAGKLLDLDPGRMRHAIGIALSQAAGFRGMFGSMCSSLMTAHGAQTGLRAAILAEKGFTSSEAALEGPYGFLDVFAERPDLEALAEGLGTRFEILRNTYKPYPCGVVIHPIIDACLELRRTYLMDPADIADVSVRVAPNALALTDRRHPKNGLEARVSLQHWVAVAFIRGTARIADMDINGAADEPTIARFQDRIETVGDDAIAPDGAEVTVRLQDGRSLISRVEHCVGSASRPMTDGELEQKFTNLAEAVIDPLRTREVIEMSWGVERLPDVGALARAAA
jgi:2-methylcitrate dehydratase PrpD